MERKGISIVRRHMLGWYGGQLLSAGGRRSGRTCVCQKLTVSEQPQLDETENSQNLQQCI